MGDSPPCTAFAQLRPLRESGSRSLANEPVSSVSIGIAKALRLRQSCRVELDNGFNRSGLESRAPCPKPFASPAARAALAARLVSLLHSAAGPSASTT